VVGIEEALLEHPDIAIFSAGGETSLEWAPKFASCGSTVIDNSSVWRMHTDKKLIVPEINGDTLTSDDKIIANPNCSTIQLVLVLKPLHDKFTVKRVVISTYQSITGTGVNAVRQMENERNGIDGEMAYPYAIDKNCIPQCDVFTDNGYTKEEMKLTNETKKILDTAIDVTATAVRVPVVGGHSEAVNIEFETEFDIDDVKKLLAEMPGITLADDPLNNEYPMPITAEGKNDVFVGRIRRDESQPKTLNLWIVSDNLRKGAATNAVQIAHLVSCL
jgi:aspartate-semialdehyde dehydrogenase